jgi:hypothetical protein
VTLHRQKANNGSEQVFKDQTQKRLCNVTPANLLQSAELAREKSVCDKTAVHYFFFPFFVPHPARTFSAFSAMTTRIESSTSSL